MDMLAATNPSSEVQAVLHSEFSSYLTAACQGMMASSFLLAHIVLPALQCHQNLANCGITLRVKSQGLPIGAGLGSSAAFAVAVAGACVQLYHIIESNDKNTFKAATGLQQGVKNAINAWAYAGEVLIHGAPSGLDNTTSCYGGFVKFAKKDTGNEFDILENAPELRILLTNTRVPRSTKVLVAGVRTLLDSFPAVVQSIFSAIQTITNTFLSKLSVPTAEGEEGESLALSEADVVRC
jgi:mevalonate kinase